MSAPNHIFAVFHTLEDSKTNARLRINDFSIYLRDREDPAQPRIGSVKWTLPSLGFEMNILLSELDKALTNGRPYQGQFKEPSILKSRKAGISYSAAFPWETLESMIQSHEIILKRHSISGSVKPVIAPENSDGLRQALVKCLENDIQRSAAS